MENETDEFYKEIADYINDAVALDDITFEDAEAQKKHELYIRSKTVKSLVKDYEKSLKYIKLKYKKELNFSKEKRFESMNWIERNHGIQKNLKAFPALIPMLDYLFDLRRRGITQKRIDEMEILSDEKKHNGHTFSCFIADTAFYQKMEKALNISKRTAQRYIKGLIAIGAIRELKNLEHNIKVYADGYYTPFENRFVKHPLLKNNMYFRNGLKAFKPMN